MVGSSYFLIFQFDLLDHLLKMYILAIMFEDSQFQIMLNIFNQ